MAIKQSSIVITVLVLGLVITNCLASSGFSHERDANAMSKRRVLTDLLRERSFSNAFDQRAQNKFSKRLHFARR